MKAISIPKEWSFMRLTPVAYDVIPNSYEYRLSLANPWFEDHAVFYAVANREPSSKRYIRCPENWAYVK